MGDERARMDGIDLSILREMFPDRILRLGGADPRISAAQIAEKLGLPVSTVKLRIRSWKNSGFYTGQIVFPNPEVLGLGIRQRVVDPLTAAARDRVAEAARSLPAAAHVWEPDTGRSFFWIGFLDSTPATAVDGGKVLARIPGVRAPEGESEPNLFAMPPCEMVLSSLDWRIVRSVRAEPDRPWTQIAGRLGLSYRTLARRLGAMIDSHALLFLPRLDFRRTANVFTMIGLEIGPEADPWDLWQRIERAGRAVLPLAPWADPDLAWDGVLRWAESGRLLSYFTTLSAPTDTLAILREAEQWRGVLQATSSFPVGWWDIPAPYDAVVEQRIASHPTPSAARRDRVAR